MSREDSKPSRRRPPLIAIEGMDRAGKSTQRLALMEHLAALGYPPVYRWNRLGYTRRIERVKRALKRLRGGRGASSPDAKPRSYPQRASRMRSPVKRRLWTTVALLDLLWEYAVTARWLRARGRAVVFDRWLCSALVDLRVNFPQDRIERRLLWRLVLRLALRPQASFLLLVSPDESLRRAHASGRRHIEPREVLEARLLEFQRISAAGWADPIDAERAPDAITRELCERLDAILAGADAAGEALPLRGPATALPLERRRNPSNP